MTFWWMLAGFLVAEAAPPVFAFALMGGLCTLALYEYLSFLALWPPTREFARDRWLRAICLGTCGAATLVAYCGSVAGFLIFVPSIAVSVLPLVLVLQDRTAGSVATLGFLGMGLLFFVFNLGHGLLMLNFGTMVLVYGFVLTELRDLVSYWVGKGLGGAYRRSPQSGWLRLLNAKIAPTVSPNKAWGAGLFSVVFIAFLAAAMTPWLPDFPKGRVSPLYGFGIGLVVGWLGLLGDLVFSMVKRDIGIKDSGSVLPGGTGVIDRIDSLVFTCPALFHLIYWKFF
jgi:phosphatidate cytidylyltransferase